MVKNLLIKNLFEKEELRADESRILLDKNNKIIKWNDRSLSN